MESSTTHHERMLSSFIIMLIFSLIVCVIEIEIALPGFPDMARDFHVSNNLIQLTLSYNFLGLCMGSILWGTLSESYGRRTIMIIGNFLLMLGALGCFVAPTFYILLGSRFIQGIGASTSCVLVYVMIADVYQGAQRIKFIGFITSFSTILMSSAPVLGGLINKIVGWRCNYGIVAFISIVSWLFLFFKLPETKKEKTIFSLKTIVDDYKCLMANNNLLYIIVLSILINSAYLIFLTCGSFLYIDQFKMDMTLYALHQGVITLTFSIVSFFIGKITEILNTRSILLTGMWTCLLGSFGFFSLSILQIHSIYLVTLSMMVLSIGIALCSPILSNDFLEKASTLKGMASSLAMSAGAFWGFIIISFTSYIYKDDCVNVACLILLVVCISFLLTLYGIKSKKICISDEI